MIGMQNRIVFLRRRFVKGNVDLKSDYNIMPWRILKNPQFLKQ